MQENNPMTMVSNYPLCVRCGGEPHATTTSHEVQRGRHTYRFHHVPACMCSACGALWIAEDTLEALDVIIDR